MDEPTSNLSTPRCAIVTGANKGMGFEICKQLVENGVVVVMTARDEERGVEALRNLINTSHVDDDSLVLFHQLDVADPASVASLFDFVNARFRKLDILINNAGVNGIEVEGDEQVLGQALLQDIQLQLARSSNIYLDEQERTQIKAKGRVIETYKLAEQCLQINYYGAKRMIEAFLPLLRLSDSPRIVNVSSSVGSLKFVSNEWAIGVLGNIESLTEERVDEVINEYRKDFKEDNLKAKDWPTQFSAYKLSKAAVNAYTRIIAKNYLSLCVNSVCPGNVKTDLNRNSGLLTVAEGAESIVKLALLPPGESNPSGRFFQRHSISSF